MSRRAGPGGRLRPSPRPHRSIGQLDQGRTAPFAGPQAPEAAVGGISSAVAGVPEDPEYGIPLADLPPDTGETVARAPVALQDAEADVPFGSTVRPFMTPDRFAAARASYGRPDTDEAEPSAERAAPGPRSAVTPRGEEIATEPRPSERRERPAAPAPRPAERDRRPPADRAPAERHQGTQGPGGSAPGSPTADDLPRTGSGGERAAPTCTAPQLRRFIKSRAYVPMHELRRRFGIDGGDDDVSPVDLESRRIFVGLPAHEGQLLGDLLRAGEVGFELSMDPETPIVVGVYSMRPVPRT